MDYDYDGVLQHLYCEICRGKIDDVKLGYKHKCFANIEMGSLNIVGNVITVKSITSSDGAYFENDISMEYLDKDEEHVKQSPLDSSRSHFTQERKLPRKVKSTITLSSNEDTNTVLREEVDATIQKVLQFCKKRNAEEDAATSIVDDMTASLNTPEIEDLEVEVNQERIAYVSDRNLMKLIELVRDNPCLWNHTLPIEQRSQYAISTAWLKVADKFPGWSPQVARKQFQNLKSSLIRRNVIEPSGSAGRKKKPWVFAPYLPFLKDILAPQITISNIPPPKPKKSTERDSDTNIENEKISELHDLGFEKNDFYESLVPTKKSKPLDAVEKLLLQNISNKMSKPPLNKWQQWGLWLGKEIEDFPDPTDRIKIQAYITTYIARKKKELQRSRTESDY